MAENFANYDRGHSFVSWALGIARNRILKYYRTRSRDRMVLSENVLIRLGDALEQTESENEDRRKRAALPATNHRPPARSAGNALSRQRQSHGYRRTIWNVCLGRVGHVASIRTAVRVH